MKPVTVRSTALAAVMALAMVAASSCGSDLTRSSKSPAYLVIDRLTATSGATDKESAFLNSDVITLLKKTVAGVQVLVPTVFDDSGTVTLSLGLRNPGTFDATGALSTTSPSPINSITVTRYHVRFVRADGRNREGVDVPYGFDGGLSKTISSSGVDISFELVRHTMKQEPPLINLTATNSPGINGAGEISTIAEITFYGHDQAGNEVSIMGQINVNFGDFGDP